MDRKDYAEYEKTVGNVKLKYDTKTGVLNILRKVTDSQTFALEYGRVIASMPIAEWSDSEPDDFFNDNRTYNISIRGSSVAEIYEALKEFIPEIPELRERNERSTS